LQGDVIGRLPGELGSAGRLLGFHRSIAGGLRGCLGDTAGGLFVGLTSNAGQPGSVALGGARIASDADGLSSGLSFGECRIVCPGSRTKLLQLRLLRERPRGYWIDLAGAYLRSSRQAHIRDHGWRDFRQLHGTGERGARNSPLGQAGGGTGGLLAI
jgi:hypothetical protein